MYTQTVVYPEILQAAYFSEMPDGDGDDDIEENRYEDDISEYIPSDDDWVPYDMDKNSL